MSRSPLKPSHAARFRSETALGLDPPQGLDDFVIRRTDGLWSYHLAVVIDDAHQGITRIVRGDDLLASLPRHRMLQAALGLNQPEVIHVPVARNSEGQKLSKQNQAPAIGSEGKVMAQLKEAWAHLETHMPRAWIEAVESPMREKFRIG
jgi:glutamyl-Q tRNA(Asp) synthetase